jgi:hypothetical protein
MHPIFQDNKSLNFGTPIWESQKKVSFGCRLAESHKVYYREGNDASSQRMWAM